MLTPLRKFTKNLACICIPLAKVKGIQRDTMVHLFNENGEVKIRAKLAGCSSTNVIYLS